MIQQYTVTYELFFSQSAAFKAQFVVIPDFLPGEDSRRDQMYSYDISAAMNAELVEPWRKLILEIRSKLSQVKLTVSIKLFAGGGGLRYTDFIHMRVGLKLILIIVCVVSD